MNTLLGLAALFLAAGMFLCMLAVIEIGRRLGADRLAKNTDGLAKGIGASEGAVFGLLGLIIAFTFSGAASRFEVRRHLITEEANAIGTAFLRIDLVPEEARPELRDLFRRYLDSRLATYANVADQTATDSKIAETAKLQNGIWTKAMAATHRPDVTGRPEVLVTPALNEMFDIATTRKAATLNHPPVAIFLLLGGLSLVGSLLVGYGISENKHRTWLHAFVFAAITSLSIYVIIDLEFPRLGLIRVDAADQVMIDLRKNMN
jgi:hypothetical protein